MANSAIDTNLVALAERLGLDRKADRARMTAIEKSVSDLSNTVNNKESNLREQININKSAIIAGDSTTLESAKEYSDSRLSIHDASNEAHPYIQGNVSGVNNRVGGIEGLLNGVMYEDNIVEGTDYTKIVDVDNAVGTGTVKSFSGKTLVWNQLVADNFIILSELVGITFTNNGDNSYTIKGTATETINTSISKNINIIANHKYLIKLKNNSLYDKSTDTNFRIGISSSGTTLVIRNNDGSLIFSAVEDYPMRLSVRINGGSTVDCTFVPQFFDLTLMFGAGNEPATVEEFEALFPAEYYEYNAGELLSAGVSEVQSVGKNLINFTDTKNINGVCTKTVIGSSVRIQHASAGTYHSANTIIDHLIPYIGKKVTISGKWKASGDNNGEIRIQWMLKSGLARGNLISLGTSGSSVTGILPERPEEGEHLRLLLYANSSSKNSVGGDYVDYEDIQVEFGDTATPYVPYKEYKSDIPLTVQNLPGYGWSAGTAKNWVDWENKKYHQEVASVNMGTLSWTKSGWAGDSGFYTLELSNLAKYPSSNTVLSNTICSRFPTYLRDELSDNESLNGICITTTGALGVRDIAYTDAVAFKTAMQGVILYYELATPIVTDISDILPSNNTLPIESGGTITFKNQHGDDYRLPVPNKLNLPIKIDLKQDTLDSANAYSNELLVESKAFTVKTALEKAIEAHYALQRTGKLYQVKIPLYDVNPTVDCIKTLDNADLVCEPSTDTTEGMDDYADIPLFQWVYCNYVRDDDGTPRPTAIEGMEDFSLTGAVDVGVMQMSFYGKMEQDEEYQILTISDTPHPELGLVPWKNCVDSTGKVLPWNIYSAFQVVTADDGLYRSQPGKAPGYRFNHNNMITHFQKKGKGYWGGTADRNTFQRIFTLIKYGKKSSQAVFAGCTSYSFQHTVSVAESDVKRVIVTTSQGNSYVVGQCVSVGEPYNGTNNDRYHDILHSIADRVLVSAKENVTIDDTEYTAIYLDVPENFTTTVTSVVSSMPCYTGQTMRVKGHHDGSITSNTNGYYGYRVQGVEYAIGQWLVASDTVGYLNDALTKPSLVYVAPRGLAHSATESVIKSTYTVAGEMTINLNADSTNRVDAPIGDVGLIDFRYGVVYPTVKGTSTANGVGDSFYQGGAALNTCREWLMAGGLHGGSNAGSACLNLGYGLGYALWYYGASD